MAENTPEVKEVKEVKENKFKKLLDLDPIFINKIGPKLKPFVKIIYYVLSIFLGLALLAALFSVGAIGFTGFVIEVLLIVINFTIVRMFAEYIANN